MLKVAIKHTIGGFTLDAAFEAPAPGVTGIYGPSGAGKSTLLACLAGLIRPPGAQILLDDDPLHSLAADLRGIGMVFQDGRLFPHMSVEQNLSYGLMRAPPGRIAGAEVAELLGLQKLLRRKPATLSGGERQRVAIGRALLSQPRLLLMDEPLSSLDSALKQEILPYLKRLRQKFDIPIVYVSHAFDEMCELADTLVLMDLGRVTAFGAIGDITARPDLKLGHRADAATILIGMVAGQHHDRRMTEIAIGEQIFLVQEFAAEPRTPARIRVRARDVILTHSRPRDISVANCLEVEISGFAEDVDRGTVFVELDVGGGNLLAHITADSANKMELRKNQPLYALIKATAIDVLVA
jgi:molybdate transport system ATP-binding protein